MFLAKVDTPRAFLGQEGLIAERGREGVSEVAPPPTSAVRAHPRHEVLSPPRRSSLFDLRGFWSLLDKK